MNITRQFVAACLAAASIAPAAVAQNTLGRTPGSVLIFPVHRSGPNWFTILSVTNSDTDPITANAFGGSTSVHFDYVNVSPGADPFRPCNCEIFDRIEFLTPGDTLSVLTTCHNAFRPGGQEGYVVVSAEDPSMIPGFAWDHDFLMGSSLVLSTGGVAYSTSAISIEALVANPAIAPAPLVFDNVTYEALPDVLFLDSFIAEASPSLAVIDFSGNPFNQNTLLFSVWNDNEFPLSTTLVFNCWFDEPLSRISPLFSPSFLASTVNDPAELDLNCDGLGDVETGWLSIDSIAVRASGPPPCAGSGDAPSYPMPPGGTPHEGGAILAWISADVASNDGLSSIGGGRPLWQSTTSQTGVFRAE